MGSTFPWFRFYNETLNDDKLKFITHQTHYEKPFILGVWAGLLSLASQSPVRGKIMLTNSIPLPDDQIGEEIGLKRADLELILDIFSHVGLIAKQPDNTWGIVNWDKRQRKSDTTGNDRVRKHRAKKKIDDDYEKHYRNVTVTGKSKSKSNNNIKDDEEDFFRQYESAFGFFSSTQVDELKEYEATIKPGWMAEAIKRTYDRCERPNWSYCRAILDNWINHGAILKEKEESQDEFSQAAELASKAPEKQKQTDPLAALRTTMKRHGIVAPFVQLMEFGGQSNGRLQLKVPKNHEGNINRARGLDMVARELKTTLEWEFI